MPIYDLSLLMPTTPLAYSGFISENYDRYLGPYIFDPYARHLVEYAASGMPQPETILEIACGTGRVTRHLQKTFPNARIIATDISNDMLTIARQLTTGTNIDWQIADAQELPFDDHSFDLVIFQFGLMFVPDKQKALAETHRVLAPGGRLLLGTWDTLENNPAFDLADKVVKKYFPIDPPRFFHAPFSLHDDDQLITWAKDAGFTNVHASLVQLTAFSPSAADTAAGMLEGTLMYATLNELAPGQLPIIKEDLTKALAQKFGEAPLVSPTGAWVVEASTLSPGPTGMSTYEPTCPHLSFFCRSAMVLRPTNAFENVPAKEARQTIPRLPVLDIKLHPAPICRIIKVVPSTGISFSHASPAPRYSVDTVLVPGITSTPINPMTTPCTTPNETSGYSRRSVDGSARYRSVCLAVSQYPSR